MKIVRNRLGVANTVALAFAACSAVPALASPTGPTVIHGAAAITNPAANILNVQTMTPRTIINWGSFSIHTGELTRFVQPSAISAVLNRVTGGDPSTILGTLQSNGRVLLINPNGVLFGAGAQIDTAGLIASTLNLSNADFLAGRMRFTEVPGAGSVVNQGTINAAGGPVYLVGAGVTNSGVITSPNGEVVLAAGKSVELVNPGTPNLRVEITAPDNEARNLGSIVADSGRIGIYAGLIHNRGTIRADSIAEDGGSIKLIASKRVQLENGSVLSASAARGIGGWIETSAPKVVVADGASISTASAEGKSGTWLIDPTDFTVAASGGDISGAMLSAQLGTNNVTLATSSAGSGNGDMFVNDAVSWSSANSLTLLAHRNITQDAPITNSGIGGVSLFAGWDGTNIITPSFLLGSGQVTLNANVTANSISVIGNGGITAVGILSSPNLVLNASAGTLPSGATITTAGSAGGGTATVGVGTPSTGSAGDSVVTSAVARILQLVRTAPTRPNDLVNALVRLGVPVAFAPILIGDRPHTAPPRGCSAVGAGFFDCR